MMVKCSRCGKIYDYDERSGVCTHCNAFTSNPEPAEGTGNVWGDAYKKKKVSFSGTGLIIVALTILIVLVPVIAIPITKHGVQVAIEDIQLEEEVEEVKAVGEAFPIQEDAKIQITGSAKCPYWEEKVPDGYDIIVVNYEWYQDDEYSYSWWDQEVFIKLPTGEYQENVYLYLLEAEVYVSEEEMAELYGYSSYLMDGGKALLFIVPEDVNSAELYIYSTSEDDEEETRNYKYIVPISWEE